MTDASGSLAYKNIQALTYATIGAGEITVRDAVEGYDLDELNRDPDNMQEVISEVEFRLEIPGLNLKQWQANVEASLNLLEAVTTRIPDHVRAEGKHAVDLYQDAILKGLDPNQLRKYANSTAFKAAVNARSRVLALVEQYGSLDAVPAFDLAIMSITEGAFYNEAGELMVPVPCEFAGPQKDCYTEAAELEMHFQTVIQNLANDD